MWSKTGRREVSFRAIPSLLRDAATTARLLLAISAVTLFSACGGDGDSKPESSTPAPYGVTIASESGLVAASLGDEQQRIFVLPGEVTQRALYLQRNDRNLLLDLAVTRGTEAVSVREESGRLFVTVDSTALRGGDVLPYAVSVRNRATGTGAEVQGTVQVLTPVTVTSGQVTEAGGVIENQAADLRIEFDPKLGAAPLNVTVKIANFSDGQRKVRLEFDRDIVGDERVVRIATPTSATPQLIAPAPASDGRMRIASADTFPATYVWGLYYGKFTEIGGFRFDQSTLDGLNAACATQSKQGSIGCWDYRVAGQLNGSLRSFSDLVRGAEPVLFVHGFTQGDELGGGYETWGEFPFLIRQLNSRYLPFEFRWRTNAKFERAADDLASAVLKISSTTGKKVTIVAHSFGGNLVRSMLQKLGGSADIDWSLHVKQVVTLGTPHSGIFTSATKVGSASFPAGQDSFAFNYCLQISCYQMGQDIYVTAPAAFAGEITLLKVLGLDLKLGGVAEKLADLAKLPPEVPFRLGIGLALDSRLNLREEVVGTKFRNGDALISLQGQRFTPRLLGSTGDWSGDIPYLQCATVFGPHVEEIVLGSDGRFPGQSFDLPILQKGYGHNSISLIPAFAYLPANLQEANVGCTAVSCDHASFLLVKSALENGVCYPTVTDPESTITDNGEASFTVTASGNQPLTYKWFINGTDIANGPNTQCSTGFFATGVNSRQVSLTGLPTGCSGAVFTVVVGSGPLLTTSKAATLTVIQSATAPMIKADEPRDAITVKGGSASFAVTATTTELVGLRYQWRLGALALTDGQTFACGSAMDVAGATTATLTLSNVPFACDGSKLVVEVSGSPGLSATSRQALLTVTPLATSSPVVSSVSPTAMVANGIAQTLTINGAGFTSGSIVQFKSGVGSGAGVWNNSLSPISSLGASQIILPMNPGKVADTINVRVCRSAAQTTAGDCSSGASAVTVTPPGATGTPDLVVQNISFNPTTVVAGGNVTVNWTIANQGNTTAAISSTVLRINNSTTTAGGANLATVNTSSLGAGGSVGQAATVAVPAVPGTYYVWVITDNLSSAGQSTAAASNDIVRASSGLTVNTSQTGPTISSVSVDPLVPIVGTQATFTVSGANLASGYVFSFPGCRATETVSASTTERRFTCTLAAAGTSLPGTISTASGSVLYSFVQTVGVAVALSTPAYQVATSTTHSCALTAAGAAKCWGLNASGEVGDGTNLPRLTPVSVLGLTSNVVAISASSIHTCALTSAGGVKCWGNNSFGQIGDGTTVFRTSPVDVVGLSSGVVQVSAGLFSTCALTNSGGVKCWGGNATGSLGDGTTQGRVIPVDVVGLASGVIAISSGDQRTCALTISGGVMCWGWNIYGQIGDGTTVDRLAPVDVVGLSSGVTAISAGAYHTCVITNTGGVKCWGTNDQGELGDGTTISRLAPVDVVGLSSGAGSLAELEERMTCAVTRAGGVKCWGLNNTGQVGDGTTQNRLIPVDVVGLGSGVVKVSAGPHHSCALTSTGGVKCWGQNVFGTLGDGTTQSHLTPVDVVGF